jgi:hypothetical protein
VPWSGSKFYKEAKVWGLALIGAGLLTTATSTFIEAPVTGEKQCEVTLRIEARYGAKATLTTQQIRLYNDAVRELDECMK